MLQFIEEQAVRRFRRVCRRNLSDILQLANRHAQTGHPTLSTASFIPQFGQLPLKEKAMLIAHESERKRFRRIFQTSGRCFLACLV